MREPVMNFCIRPLLVMSAVVLVSPVMAQSTVTIYGIMDVAVNSVYGGLSSSKYVSSGGNSTSRLGFTGREDLGGGLYAGFDLEAQVDADTGAGGATNTNNQASGATATGAMTWNRYSILKFGGTFGELRLGRDYTAHYRNRVDVDPFGNQGIASSQAQAGSLGGVTNTRASNMINYVTPPTLGGFYAVLNYYLGENQSGIATSKDGTGASFRVGYRAGPWLAAISQGKTNYASTATIGDITSTNAALAYDFGPARLMAGLYRDRVERNSPLTGKGFIVSTTVPVGSHEIKAAYSRYGTDAAGSPTSDKLVVGYVHNLSKRTALFTNVAYVKNSGGASASLPGSTTTANGNSKGINAGMRHAF